jgi:hypothetical protein
LGNRKFESISLQQRVNKLSVPLRRAYPDVLGCESRLDFRRFVDRLFEIAACRGASVVHHRLRFLTFPMRASRLCSLWSGMRPLRFRRVPFGRDVTFDPGGATASRITMPHILPSTVPSVSASATLLISWLNLPANTPPLRRRGLLAHDVSLIARRRPDRKNSRCSGLRHCTMLGTTFGVIVLSCLTISRASSSRPACA